MGQTRPAETRFRLILVPLDGSATGEQALPVAAAIARRSAASLHLVTVHVPLPLPTTAEEPMLDGERERELRRQRDTDLASTADAVAAAQGFSPRSNGAVPI